MVLRLCYGFEVMFVLNRRVKEVDWIPFLTTRIVDDAATHLRLFKQARVKIKQDEKPKSPRNSPRREVKSPKRSHKRNKSETDLNRHVVSRNVLECKGILCDCTNFATKNDEF